MTNFDTNYDAFKDAEERNNIAKARPHVQSIYYHAVICALLGSTEPKVMIAALDKAGKRLSEFQSLLGGAA